MELRRLSTGMSSPLWSSSRTTLLTTRSKADAMLLRRADGSGTAPSGMQENEWGWGNGRHLDASSDRELFPCKATLHGQSRDSLTGRKRLPLAITQHRNKQNVLPAIHKAISPRSHEHLQCGTSFTALSGAQAIPTICSGTEARTRPKKVLDHQ